MVYSTSVVAAEKIQKRLLSAQASSTFKSTSMFSGPKNQNRPESAVYLIGAPVPLLSEVFQSTRTAKRLLLRQTTFVPSQSAAVDDGGREEVTAEFTLAPFGRLRQTLRLRPS